MTLWSRRVRELTAVARLSAFVRNGDPSERISVLSALLMGLAVGFVLGYVCHSVFG